MTHIRSTGTLLITALLLLLLLLAPIAAASAAPDAAATSAASRVARELVANDWRMPTSSDSVGTTIDAIVLLAASGTGADAARAAIDRIQIDGPAWAAASGAGDEGRRAKLAFALQIDRRDVSTYEAQLRAAIGADGRVGTSTNMFGQAWAVIVLARTPGGAPPATVNRLSAQQCATPRNAQYGGFGFGSCATVDGDATGMAVMALRAAGRPPSDPALRRALGWMQSHQLRDGSFAAQMSPRAGNANSTGLVAFAARQIGAPTATMIANAASSYVRELQVSCASPLIAGDSASIGGGFPRSWIGSIAYDAAAQDSAIVDGIPAGRQTQWRYATLQAPLTLPRMRALTSLTLTGAVAKTAAAPTCPGVPAATGATSRPATTLRVRASVASFRPVATGSAIQVTATKLAPRERYVIMLSGRVVARGSAPASGVASRRFIVPRVLATSSGRMLRVLGSNPRRTGFTTIVTAAPQRLVLVTPTRVRASTRTRVVVRGLMPREAFRITLARKVVARSFATPVGTAVVRVPVRRGSARQQMIVCGAACTRRGAVMLQVRR